jgi:hypothetical protein
MRTDYIPFMPESIDELLDKLGTLMLSSPKFEDDYFTNRNLETVFFGLFEGLKLLRPELGESKYERLVDISTRMKAHFAADPDDENGRAIEGRELVLEMQDILEGRSPPANDV